MPPRTKIVSLALLCSLAVALAGAGAARLWRPAPVPVALDSGSLLSPRRALPEFSLTDQRGRAFGNAELGGSWSVMFFGYTNCPDLCPATLSQLAALERRLRAAAPPLLVRVIFVSVDARRDTPRQLAQYVPYFDPEFIGLTASTQPQIEALAARLGVGILIRPTAAGGADGAYSVDHSGELFVLDPRGRLAAVLSGPFTVDALQSDLRKIVAAPT